MQSDNAGGWPERPGVPMEPERDGWHWVEGWPRLWDGARGIWWQRIGGPTMAAGCAPQLWGAYGGPCLPPSEVAAREAAAREEGAKAERERMTGQIQCEAEAERDEFFNRLGRITSELGLPMDCTAGRIIEAIRDAVDDEREACASVSVKVEVPDGAENWTPLEAWEEALIIFDAAFRDAIRARGAA